MIVTRKKNVIFSQSSTNNHMYIKKIYIYIYIPYVLHIYLIMAGPADGFHYGATGANTA